MKCIKLISLILIMAIINSSAFALEPGTTESAQVEITEPLQVQSQPSEPVQEDEESVEINTALSDLNYKIEYLKTRYDSLSREIEALKIVVRDQKKLIAEKNTNSSKVEAGKVQDMEVELGVIRSEISQIREDISSLKSKYDTIEPPKEDILKSPWIPASAFVMALLALLL